MELLEFREEWLEQAEPELLMLLAEEAAIDDAVEM